MVDYWNFIEKRLHEESMLRYPLNRLRGILRSFVNGALNDFYDDALDVLAQSFLLTCTGKYLDLRGVEYNLKREVGEDDESYRQRLFNLTSCYLSVNFIKMQNALVYTKDDVEDSIRLKMTSNNPYLNNEYAVIPPNVDVFDFLENDVLFDDVYVLYKRGW
ncbi:MAG: hypothetical protein BZ136_07555 [Methanosphaera sp. rholeuAM74]|nr:MAG: hypothetical protein BZ136_07555 [Methanosphaera sp. rholeuAM74]